MSPARLTYYYNTLSNGARVFAYTILKDWEQARDVVADCFVSMADIEQGSNINSYLTQSVRWACMKILQKRKIDQRYREHYLYLNDEAWWSSQEIKATILTAILDLPPSRRRIFELRYFEGYKTREIAEILGIREGTVCAQLKRSIDYLKKVI